MQENSKIDGKFKIANPIYDAKKFAEDPLEIHPKDSNDESYFPGESVTIAPINSKNYNSNNNNYSNILSDKRFTVEHVNSDDPNEIASDSKITINSIGHLLTINSNLLNNTARYVTLYQWNTQFIRKKESVIYFTFVVLYYYSICFKYASTYKLTKLVNILLKYTGFKQKRF